MNASLLIKIVDFSAAIFSFVLAKSVFAKDAAALDSVEINIVGTVLSASFLFFSVIFGSYKMPPAKFDNRGALLQIKIFIWGLIATSLLTFIVFKEVNLLVLLTSSLSFLALSFSIRTLLSVQNERAMKVDQQNFRVSSVNVLVYGAGEAGQQIAAQCAADPRYRLKGYLDDDKNLHGKTIEGVAIYNPQKLSAIRRELLIDEIFVAIPSANPKRYKEIINFLSSFKLKLKTLPSLVNITSNQVGLQDITDIKVEDVLLREPVTTDKALMGQKIEGKIVMVTGAAGSIGSELCRIIVDEKPSQLLFLDFNEYGLYKIHGELVELTQRAGADNCEVTPLLLSVTDENAINQCFQTFRPEIVFHAAAYKHVSFVEENLCSGLKNNIWGTYYVAAAALKFQVSDFILVSTDKAVRPTSVMGASKRVCELIVQGMAERPVASENKRRTCFSIVRFGNVLGSSGSVVPLFMERLKQQKPLPVRHREVTRYFMTIKEAAQLVLSASALATGGEVFVLDMGEPIKIYELAKKMIELHGLDLKTEDNPHGTAEIEITGLLPGEKLYEELLIGGSPVPTSHPKILRANEQYIGLAELEHQLEKMRRLIVEFDAPNIYKELKRLIPEFAPEKQPIDHLHKKKQLNELISFE